jgi:O-succinylbenzoic acid--CoA ligase
MRGRYVECPIASARRRDPRAPALIAGDRSWNYAALDEEVEALADVIGKGVAAGARVGLIGPEHAAYLFAFWALLRSEAVACPLSSRLPAEAVRQHVRELGVTPLLASDSEAADRLCGIGVPVFDLSRVNGSPITERPRRTSLALDAPATILLTSGSTGRPKSALHRLSNHLASARGANANMPLGAGDRWLLSLPLYHVSGIGILFRTWLAGAAVVLPDPGESIDRAIERRRITHLSLVPAQLVRLLEGHFRCPPSIQAVLLGGSTIPPGLIDEALAQGWPLHTTYGLTEMASQVTTTRPGAGVEELRTAGRLLDGRELRLAADGEILVRGETRFAGYLTPDGLETPFDADGWFSTGDRGAIDAAGRLVVVGRKDNQFISGGENIQPEEIESALLYCPAIVRALVVPVPDAVYGQRPVAFVEAGSGDASEEAILGILAKRLPRFKFPMAFLPWPDEVSTGGLKPARRWFEEEARRRLGR